MFDVKWIRENPDAFDRGLARRGLGARAAEILALEAKWRAAETSAQEALARRNRFAKEIGAAKAQGRDIAELLNRVAIDKDVQAATEQDAARLRREIDDFLAGLPNIPADDVPDGKDEHGNQLVRSHGTPPSFGFSAKEHFVLGEALGLMDFARAGKLSGARFVVLKGQLARLERAIGQFMIDLQTNEFGYTEISPPLMVRDEAAFGTGSLPRFGDDLFRTTTGLWLIPTAEVPLTNLVADEILDESDLPLRFTAWTPCFRSEAVLKGLGLAYRVMLLCGGDMGFASRKTYDIEVWLPGQQTYREISSCSNCGDFQARRMKARFRSKGEKGTRFVHTLNGSGLAVGRTLVAVLENYQQGNGSILVPETLRPYMGGLEVIGGDV